MFEKSHRAQLAGKAFIAVIAMALAAALTACASGQTAAGESSAAASQAGASGESGWRTLGDVFAAQGGGAAGAAGWDDSRYVYMVEIDGSYYRIVAKMDEESSQKLEEVDWSKDDVESQNQKAVSGAPVESVEDVSGELIEQDELDALVGKTGKDLEEAGFTFQDYFLYGGDETGANYVKGYFAYSFLFDAAVSESATAEGAAPLADAPITEGTLSGPSNDATDPTKVS